MHFAEMAASLGAPDAAANKRHRTEQLVSGLEGLQLKTDPETPLWLCPVYKVRAPAVTLSRLRKPLVDNGLRPPPRAVGSGLHAHHDDNPFQQICMLRASVTCSRAGLWEAQEEEESTSFAAEHYLLPVSSGRYGADTTMWHSRTMTMNHNYMTDQVLAK